MFSKGHYGCSWRRVQVEQEECQSGQEAAAIMPVQKVFPCGFKTIVFLVHEIEN